MGSDHNVLPLPEELETVKSYTEKEVIFLNAVVIFNCPKSSKYPIFTLTYTTIIKISGSQIKTWRQDEAQEKEGDLMAGKENKGA